MKKLIILLVLLTSFQAKSQTIDTAFTHSHQIVTAQIVHIKPDFFLPDSAKYLSIQNYNTDALSYISFNWVLFNSSGLSIKNKSETVTGANFAALKASIQSANSLIPILTWIGTAYSLTFK